VIFYNGEVNNLSCFAWVYAHNQWYILNLITWPTIKLEETLKFMFPYMTNFVVIPNIIWLIYGP